MKSCLIVTGGYDNTIKLWKPESANCYRSLQHGESQVNCLEISPDRNCIAAGGHTQLRFYDQRSSSVTHYQAYEHLNNITAIGYQDQYSIWSGSEDGTVKVWDLRNHQVKQDLLHNSPVTCGNLNPHMEELITGDQKGTITRWNLRLTQCAGILIPVPGVFYLSIATSPDGEYTAAISDVGDCYIWTWGLNDEGKTGMVPFLSFPAHPQAIGLKCRFSADGSKLLTTSSDKTVRLFDVRNRFAPLGVLGSHGAWVWDAAFSNDGAYLVSVSSDKIGRLWDVALGRVAMEFKGHAKSITALALNDAV